MNLKKTIQTLLFSIIIFFPLLEVHSKESSDTLDDWNVEIELKPLADEHREDVINLVPKQSILMKAYVWYPTTRMWIVDYPDWDMPGAGIEKLHTSVPNLERQHEGKLQYGHTQNYILTPVDIGVLDLRQKGLDISSNKAGIEIVPFSKPIRINVDLPEGVYSIEEFLPAYALDVKQEFFHYTQTSALAQVEQDEVLKLTLKKGEMLERRISIKAKGIRGSSIPRLLHADNKYKTQYESSSKDVNGLFGFEGGKRVESLFYIPDAGGEIELKAVDIKWWQLKDKKQQVLTLGGVTFSSVSVEAYEESIGLSWWEKNSKGVFTLLSLGGLFLVLVFTVYILFRRLNLHLWQWMQELVISVSKSETLLFLKLCVSLVIGAKKRSVRYFNTWQYRYKRELVDEEISNYFYGYDDNSKRPNRFRIILLCWKFRKDPKENHSSQYNLPEL